MSFYAPPHVIENGTFRLEGAEVRHAVQVLRKRPGDTVRLVDGLGTEFVGRIQSVEKNRLIGEVIESRRSEAEPRTRVTLAPGLIKGPRMDLLIEKATELGAHEFWPILCERGVRKINRAKDRWQNVALSAIKQSGRAYLPQVKDPMSFEEVLSERTKFELGLAASPSVERRLDRIETAESVLVLLGPEGGFTSEELEAATDADFIPFSMGRRVLRAETASWVALTLILNQRGEL
jgi:16S rRNA (uracil1498-N3)-methyltransferase